MTVLAAALFGLCVLLMLWSYVLYPRVIERLAAGTAAAEAPDDPGSSAPSVEVLVSAADEEAVIGQRVDDLLAQRYAGAYGVAVGCDGSADHTADRARDRLPAAAEKQIALRVVVFPARRGKAAVLNDLLASSAARIVVFTDANTRFDPEAVIRLARAFRDPGVGAACGRLVLEGSDAEGAFWDRETRLKDAEGRLGVCLGANGAIYAARASEVEPLAPDTTSMDDFLIPLHAARRGARIVFVGDAVAHEAAARDALAEMGRRFRIGVGAGQVLRRERWIWNVRRRGLLSLVFLSRKAARWLAPPAAFASCAAALLSPVSRPVGLVFASLVTLCALFALARPRPAGWTGRLYYFAVINVALGIGVLAGLAGYRRPAWKPVAR